MMGEIASKAEYISDVALSIAASGWKAGISEQALLIKLYHGLCDIADDLDALCSDFHEEEAADD